MALTALSGLTPTWFTPEGQDDSEPKTRFKIKPLNGAQYSELLECIEPKGEGLHITYAGRERVLSLALINWENYSNNEGKLDFNPANQLLIPCELRQTLVNEIMSISSLTGEQVKN